MFGFFKERGIVDQRGIVEQHIEELSSFSVGKRRKATNELASLSCKSSFHSEMIKLESISRLLHLVSKDRDNNVREYALNALKNLTIYGNVMTKSALVEAGAISQCVHTLLDSSYWPLTTPQHKIRQD